MRAIVICCVIIGLSVLLFLGIASLRRMETGVTRVVGADLSSLEAGAVPGHIEALHSPDPSARKKAAHMLAQIGPEARAATPTLLKVAKDPEGEVRTVAVMALGETSQGTQDAIPELIESIKDEDAGVRAAATRSLAEIWRTSAPQRNPGGRGPAPQPRQEGQDKPGQNPPGKLALTYVPLAQKAVPVLTAALRDADARVRAGAAEALAETGPLAEPAVPDLVKLLQNDEDRDVRLQATLALHNIGPGAKAAVPVLVGKLRTEKDDGVRVNTAAALGMIHSNPEAAVPALVETFLTDKHPDARRCAMMSISQFGADAKLAVPLLEQALKNSEGRKNEASSQRINQMLSHLKKQSAKPDKDSPEARQPSSRESSSKSDGKSP
jgi:HEAT repeat protein